MKLLTPLLLLTFLTSISALSPLDDSTDSFHQAATDTVTIFIEPLISTSKSAVPLATISYNPSTLIGSITSYEPPYDLLPSSSPSSSSTENLALISISPSPSSTTKTNTKSKTLLSLNNFQKGYSPFFLLTLDQEGAVLSVSCKSAAVDAGATRDFGPKVRIERVRVGVTPTLGPSLVVTEQGRVKVEGEEDVPEKTMLQKYWWVLLGAMFLLMTTGGGGE